MLQWMTKNSEFSIKYSMPRALLKGPFGIVLLCSTIVILANAPNLAITRMLCSTPSYLETLMCHRIANYCRFRCHQWMFRILHLMSLGKSLHLLMANLQRNNVMHLQTPLTTTMINALKTALSWSDLLLRVCAYVNEFSMHLVALSVV